MPTRDLTNVNVSASFQRLLQIDDAGNQYNGAGSLINTLRIQKTIYPEINFAGIDYTMIPNGSYMIGFDSGAGGKLVKLDNSGSITAIEGAGGGGIITSISDTNTVDLAIISGDLSAVIKYQNSPDIVLSSDSSGLIASFASANISQFTNNTGYTTNTGTVTSVAALTLGTTGTDLSSTVSNSTTTPVITLNVPTASATNRGALSSSDWSAFDGKQNALGFTPEDVANKSTSASLGTSNTLYPTQNAVKSYVDTAVNSVISSGTPESVTLFIDATPDVITTGKKAQKVIPFNCYVSEWYIISGQTGSIEFDIRKSSFSSYPSTSTIITSGPPELISQSKNSNTSVTGWVSISSGDVLEIFVSSNDIIQNIGLYITLQKT